MFDLGLDEMIGYFREKLGHFGVCYQRYFLDVLMMAFNKPKMLDCITE